MLKGSSSPSPSSTTMRETKHQEYRGISLDVVKFLDVKSDEHERIYSYPTQKKKRILPKDFSDNKGFKANELYAMDKYNAGSSKFVTIVEGEDDVGAALTILGLNHHVVSPPSATSIKQVLQNKDCYDFLDAYPEIILAMEDDEASKRTVEVLNSTFPGKCSRVSLTKYKDACEYLENDARKDFLYAWMNRKKYVPEFNTRTPEQFIAIFDDSEDDDYVPTGISDYDDKARGLMQSRLTLIDAPEGLGKTELMRYLEYRLISEHPDIPFAFCHFEETPLRTILGLASYHLKKDVTSKHLIDDPEEVRQAIREMTENENRHMLKMTMDEDPKLIIDRIKFYSNVYGCKYFFFEPIQDLAMSRQDNSSVVQFLDSMAVSLSRLTSETGCGIITIAHQNDDGQIRDSRMIAKQADVRIVLDRNVEENENVTTLTLKKNRPTSTAGYAGQVEFDRETFTLKEYVG